MDKQSATGMVLIVLLLLGCATPAPSVWVSRPSVQKVATPEFEARLEPLKEDKPFYVSFRLTIANKSQNPFVLDWNQTRYLHNNKDQGVFVFTGIDPEKIQGAIPPESIAPGASFTRDISPLRTVAFMPRERIPEEGKRGFIAGLLPAGNNGIHLVLKQGEREVTSRMTVRLSAHKEGEKK